MKPLPLQLEIALQTGHVVPWEFDIATQQFSWFEIERSGRAPVPRMARLQDWLEAVELQDRSAVSDALQTRSGQDVQVEFQIQSSSGIRRIQATGRADLATGKIVGVSVDLTKKLRTEGRLLAQQEVTEVLAHWTSIEEVSQRILQIVCAAQQWELANMWRYDPVSQRMVLLLSWSQPGMEAASAALSRLRSFDKGSGLPGRVWATGSPEWVTDLARDKSFPRIHSALEHGLHSAAAFPICLGDELFGVMEYFSLRVRKENPEVLAFLRAVGSQMGQGIERRRAEADLRESEERHRTLSETASDAIITIDQDSKIIFANPAIQQVFGYSVEEVLGQDLMMLMPAEMRNRHVGGLARYLSTGVRSVPWRNVEMPGQHKSGELLHLELSFGEFKREGRQYFTGVARDVGARKQTEEALKTSEKLAATGRLAASMAHEINNPLASVMNVLYLLATDDALGKHNRELVTLAGEELQRVAHIVKHTLGFYRESTLPVETDLVEVVESVLELFANQLRARSVEVSKRFETRQKIATLPGEIRQVIANLVENAIQAIPVKGKIILRLEDAIEPRNPYREGVRLIVADNGAGISASHRRRIFEPFFTTKGEKGTGLGLWVSRGIVEKHGGRIRVRSSVTPGKSGTVFSVFFPRESRLASVGAAA